MRRPGWRFFRSPPGIARLGCRSFRDDRCHGDLLASLAQRICPFRARFTAGAAGFLNFSQSGERPDRQRDPSRFETIPSNPILQACRNTTAPSGSASSMGRSGLGSLRPSASKGCGRR